MDKLGLQRSKALRDDGKVYTFDSCHEETGNITQSFVPEDIFTLLCRVLAPFLRFADPRSIASSITSTRYMLPSSIV